MTGTADSLIALEGLMNEFFSPTASNERNREIENVLGEFSRQRGAWKHCLYYMAHTRNTHVSMYCLNTMENVINKQWIGLQGDEKTEIRSTLYRFLLESHRVAPHYIRNKLVKLVVNIARLSWPHFYPDFFTNMLALSRSGDTVLLCVVFLQTVSEELAFPKEELAYSRRVELRRLLTQQVPTILSLLANILDGIIEKHRNGATATPPPSPTHHQGEGKQLTRLPSSPTHASSFLSSVFHNLERSAGCKNVQGNGDDGVWVLPLLDGESQVLAAACLTCLTQLFSWIQLSFISLHLVNTVFTFASAGAYPNHSVSALSDSCSDGTLSLGVLAMGAINEILGKNFVPVDLEEFLLQMFRHTFQLLQRLVQQSEPPAAACLEEVDPSYLNKFSDFLHLFISVHLRRFENNPQFPVMDFLALLYQYTFTQPSLDLYLDCINVWDAFLDHLATAKHSANDRSAANRYEDVLLSLVHGILNKIQLRHNQAELEELEHEISSAIDDDTDSSYGEMGEGDVSEWQAFLATNLELLAKVADLLPDQIFLLVNSPLTDAAKIYLSLTSTQPVDSGQAVVPVCSSHGSRVRRLHLAAERDCPRLHCHLRDLSSLLQAVGRLSVLFLGDALPSRASQALQVIEKLVELSTFSSGMKFFEMQMAADVLHSDFVEVHAQILAALRAWVHWLSQLYGQQFVQVFPGGTQTHCHQDTCHTINRQLLVAATSSLTRGVPPLIVNCGVQLLLSISVLVRSPVALEMDQLQALYVNAASVSQDLKVRCLLYRALTNFLLLPWPSFVADHRPESRRAHLRSFVASFTDPVLKLDVRGLSEDKARRDAAGIKLREVLTLVRSQVEELNGAEKSCRETYYICVTELTQITLTLLPVYLQDADTCESILLYLVSVMRVLRVQMGPSRVEGAVRTLLEVFSTRFHLQGSLVGGEGGVAGRVVERFLKLLELIVCEPGQEFRRFVPNTLTLCLDHIYPPVAAHASPEVKGPLFALLLSLLLNNWKYFFRPSVHLALGTSGTDAVENEAQLLQVLQAFGQSLMQPEDLSVFRHNLEALEVLNAKYKLYHKTVFKEKLLGQFITVLLQVLLHKAQDLMQEEITITIYNMASVDFSAFFSAFVPHFLRDSVDGIDDDQRVTLRDGFKADTDLPSFTQNVLRFVTDLRYYRMCNASLPPGTIQL